jgi:hypothetical protein
MLSIDNNPFSQGLNMKNIYKISSLFLIALCTLHAPNTFTLNTEYNDDAYSEPHYVNMTDQEKVNTALQEEFLSHKNEIHFVDISEKFETFNQDLFKREVLDTRADYAVVFEPCYLRSYQEEQEEEIRRFKNFADKNYKLNINGKEKLVKYIVSSYVANRGSCRKVIASRFFIFKDGKLVVGDILFGDVIRQPEDNYDTYLSKLIIEKIKRHDVQKNQQAQ